MSTPNDTRLKQFFTAVAMTILFAIGVLCSWALWAFYHWLYTSPEQWVRICGVLVHVGFWVNNLVVVVLSILSMLDWMRSTCKPKDSPLGRHGHHHHIVAH